MTLNEDAPSQNPPTKRRKVRKGTQSCWACKRRKVRCIFSVPTNSVCDNCTKRKTQCIPQEYVDVDEASSFGREYALGLEDRLSRVEDVLQTMTRDNHTSHDGYGSVHTRQTASMPRLETLPESGSSSCAQDNDANATAQVDTIPTPDSSCTSPTAPLASQYTGLAQDLVVAWPHSTDLDQIYTLPISLSTHTHMHLCTPPSAKYSLTSTSTREMLQLPPPGSHPVLIARKLLFLGSLLQGALSASPAPSDLSSSKLRGIMSRAISAAISLVTTNDALTGCVEGVECIMIEAMIHNYTGNLHRAWLAVRRGIAVAQVLGLDRGAKARVLDPVTKKEFDAVCFCFRVVEMERYLSITLGLAPSEFGIRALAPEAVAACGGLDRLARMHCIVAERLLRSHEGVGVGEQFSDLREMEELLQQAASELPPQWWLIPDMSTAASDGGSLKPFQEVGRLNYQFSHYHLIIRLHLPYMLRSAHHDESKMAAASASRDVLLRYIAFRRWNPGHFYCRGTDFLAFMAVVVLCLAHISSRSTRPQDVISKLMASSRLSDRGMMERTVEILGAMRDDATAGKLVRIMQHMLDVELDAFKGVAYKAVASERVHNQAEYEGTFVNGRTTLQLHIPYVGTIDLHQKLCPASTMEDRGGETSSIGEAAIEKVVSSNNYWAQQSGPSDGDWTLQDGDPDFAAMLDSAQYLGAPEDLTLQSINESLFSSLFDGLDSSVATYDLNLQ
ncbi:hypothetical protein DE146DRAFT_760193 [Phaeosphaeria sp. MPI-PUGE-AT-0046c]|nr:hypothetical protein DE146DRAFT_760193 [Phaeosphaeria sp. MPI-PUGE-AT-0046c]